MHVEVLSWEPESILMCHIRGEKALSSDVSQAKIQSNVPPLESKHMLKFPHKGQLCA